MLITVKNKFIVLFRPYYNLRHTFVRYLTVALAGLRACEM